MTGARIAPLPFLAAALIVGIALGATLGGAWWLTLALTVVAVGGGALAGRLPASPAILIAAVALAAMGHARLAAHDAKAPPPIATAIGRHTIEGVARDDGRVRGSRARVDLDVTLVDGEPIRGGLRATLVASDPIRAGDRLRIVGDIEPPAILDGFDYPGYLRARGIAATLAFPERWEHLGSDWPRWRAATRGLRRLATTNIERSLPEPSAALAAGILIGERTDLPGDIADDLRATGTTHLVVVSGQNVAITLGLLLPLLTLVMPRRRASVALLALLPLYVITVGADPPVVRAAIMAAAGTAAVAGGRRTPAWVALLYAAAIMLALDPTLVRDPSFLLSASATAGVIVVAPVLRDVMLAALRLPPDGARAAFIETVATASAATACVLPVQLAVFERLTPWSIPTNVVVAPVYQATLVTAGAAAFLGASTAAADVFRRVGDAGPRAFLAVVEVMARLPGTEARAPWPASVVTGALVAALWYAALGALLWIGQRSVRGRRAAFAGGGGLSLATVTLAVVAVGAWSAAWHEDARPTEVAVLDVGQGAATLVRSGGATVLIDVGPPDGAVVRALDATRGSRRIDAVLLTHADIDHAGGLAELRARYEVGRVLASPETIGALRLDRGEPIDIGDRLRVGQWTLTVLGPPPHDGLKTWAENDRSLVVVAEAGGRRILFPGDIEATGEAWLVASDQRLDVDAVVAPHHGSATSSTAAFVAAVSAETVVVSVGRGNPYGHPSPAVLERWQRSAVYRTDRDGSVRLTLDGERLRTQVDRR